MNWLQQLDDVAVPNKNFKSVANELMHPDNLSDYAEKYSRVCNREITIPSDLIECFFENNSSYSFAGFKSIPSWHLDYRSFIKRKDIKFIVLTRNDIASNIASIVLAHGTGYFDRTGEPQKFRWTFRRREAGRIFNILTRFHGNRVKLGWAKDAIGVTYEDLCNPDFSCPALDQFFGRHIRIADPKPPTSARDYVTNWEEFEAFITRAYRELDSRAAGGEPDR